MRPGSHELNELPDYPADISVRAIAGDVWTRRCLGLSCSSEFSTFGDLVVPISSATDGATRGKAGDGSRVFKCFDLVATANVSNPWCGHTGMPGAAQVQADVKASLKAYLASIKPEPAAPTTPSPKPSATGTARTLFGMTLRLDPNWRVSGTESNGMTITTNCSGDPCPQLAVSSVDWLGDQSVGTMGDLPECSGGESALNTLTRKGERAIGNKQASYFEAELCAPGTPSETMRVWEIHSGGKHLMLTSTESSGFRVPNLDSLLARATW
jgi:hypothetical protein